MDFQKVINVIEQLHETYIEEETDECNHENKVVVDGFITCTLCCCVLQQVFKTECEDHSFYEDKRRILSIYSKVKEIQKNFMKYYLNAQKTITKEEATKFILCWNDKEFTQIRRKDIRSVIIECDLNIDDYNNYYCLVKFGKIKKSESQKLNKHMIDEIMEMCKKFIQFNKGKIKNINNKVLVYLISKDIYKISLDDYLGIVNNAVLERYSLLYEQFKKGINLIR